MTADRSVKLVCTGQGRGGHAEKRIDRVGLVDGEAVSLESGRHALGRAIAGRASTRRLPDFSLLCRHCGRAPQVSTARMTQLVAAWLEQEPTRRSVVRDISHPAIARLF